MSKLTYFRDFEEPKAGNQGGDWPLDDWYRRVREIPVPELTSGDLATAVRQGVWLEASVPAVIQTLEKDVWAGDLYDGELIAALRFVPREWWDANAKSATRVTRLISKVCDSVECDEDLRSKLAELQKRLSPAA